MNSNLSNKINRLLCLVLALVMVAGFVHVPASADAKYDAYVKELEEYNAKKSAYDAYLREIAYYNAHNAEWADYDAKLAEYNRYLKYLSDLDAYYAAVENYDNEIAAYMAYTQYLENAAKCEAKLNIIEAVINGNMYETLTGETVEAVLASEDEIAGYTVTSKQTVRDAGDATHALINILETYSGKNTVREKFNYYKSKYSSLKSNFAKLFSCLSTLYGDNAVKIKLIQEGKDRRYCEFLCQLYTISLCLDDSQTVNKNWRIKASSGWLNYSQLGGYGGLEDNDLSSPENMTFPNDVPKAEYPETPVMPNQVSEALEPIAPSGKRPVLPSPVADPGNPPSPPTYTVTWKNYDGTVIKTDTVAYGATPSYSGATPTRAATEQYTYSFSGWSPTVLAVSGNTTYTAQFRSQANSYNVTWKNHDGTVMKTDTVAYGETPSYSGTTPTKAATSQYTYAFSGWSPAVTAVSGNAVYTAQFTETTNIYTVTWKNYDGTVLKTESLAYGATPSYSGAPTRAATAQYNYNFSGWTPAVTAVSGNAVYTAKYTETVNQYKITWKNYDGTVLKTESLSYGEMPAYSGTPARAATAQYTYAFSGWTPAVTSVSGNVTYTAKYTETVNQYKITWKNYDGTVMKTEALTYGETPKYNGTPTRAATAQYTYAFSGWTPAVTQVKADATYTAQFTETVNKYTVTWKNYDGTVLRTDSLAYGATPSYSGTPTRAATAQYTYTFSGWSPSISSVKTDAAYTAQFTEAVNKYTVTWKNYNGNIIKTDTVDYGVVPTYTGSTPTKPGNSQNSYIFDSWSPNVSEVKGNVSYTATFTASTNKYTVTWNNYDGTLLERDTGVDYGEMPYYNGNVPQKAGDGQYSYKFTGWSPAVSTVSGNVTYTATFERSENTYDITWKNYDGSVLKVDTLTYGVTPSYSGTPTRAATAQYTYAFTGWSPVVTSVKSNATYTAQFTETTNIYTVTWKNYDGTVLRTDGLAYGATPLYEGTPARAATAQYTYAFAGWSPSVSSIKSDVTYTAQFTETVNKYTVTWQNHDGTELKTETFNYGDLPEYRGGVPQKMGDGQYSYKFTGWSPAVSELKENVVYTAVFERSENTYDITWKNYDGSVLKVDTLTYGATPSYGGTPTRSATTQYTYTFTGWSPEVAAVTENATYTAQFSEKVNEYTVVWKNYDGTVLITDVLPYGVAPSYEGQAPQKPSTDKNFYTFLGWSPKLTEVKENATYTAVFTEYVKSYTVVWKDGDTVLYTDTLYYGETPVYRGSTEKEATKEKSFEFSGWSPSVAPVTGDAVYTATYKETTIYYGVTWQIGNSILPEQLYEYMQIPKVPDNPEQYLENEERSFAEFIGWDKKVGPVTDNTVYKAKFRADIFDLTANEKESVSLIPSASVYTVVTEKEDLPVGLSKLAKTATCNGKDLIIEYPNGVQIYFPNKLASEITERKLHVSLQIGNTVQPVRFLSTDSSDGAIIFGGRVILTDDAGNVVTLTGWQLRVPVENGNMSGLSGYSLDYGEKSYKLAQSGNYAVFVSDGSAEFKLVRMLSVRVDANEGGNVLFENVELREGDVVTADIKTAIGYEVESISVYGENEGEKIDIEFDPGTMSFVMPPYNVVFNVKFRKLFYTVNFYVDSELYSTAVYGYGEDIVMPEDPTKTDDSGVTYVFAGWTPDVNAKVLGNADYTANFNVSTVAGDDYGRGDYGFNFPYKLFIIAVVFFGVSGTGVYFIVRFVRKKRKNRQ